VKEAAAVQGDESGMGGGHAEGWMAMKGGEMLGQ